MTIKDLDKIIDIIFQQCDADEDAVWCDRHVARWNLKRFLEEKGIEIQ